jgi:hypothetical protein
VQAAFRGLALQHHPDRYTAAEDKTRATKRFQVGGCDSLASHTSISSCIKMLSWTGIAAQSHDESHACCGPGAFTATTSNLLELTPPLGWPPWRHSSVNY